MCRWSGEACLMFHRPVSLGRLRDGQRRLVAPADGRPWRFAVRTITVLGRPHAGHPQRPPCPRRQRDTADRPAPRRAPGDRRSAAEQQEPGPPLGPGLRQRVGPYQGDPVCEFGLGARRVGHAELVADPGLSASVAVRPALSSGWVPNRVWGAQKLAPPRAMSPRSAVWVGGGLGPRRRGPGDALRAPRGPSCRGPRVVGPANVVTAMK